MKARAAREVLRQTAAKRRLEARLASHAEEFQDAVSKIEDAYREGLRAFCAWVIEAWELEDQTAWDKSYGEPYPGDAYRNGWQDALASLQGALELFLEEHGY